VTLQVPIFLQVGIALTALVLVGLLGHVRRRRALADFIGGQRAAARLVRSNLYRLRLERALVLGLGGIALSVAAAGPQWSEDPAPGSPVKRIVLAIDVSASMQAADALPTRLADAVAVARRLVDAAEGHRVGLLLFAGTGYPLAPPTHDHEAIHFLLGGVTPTIASALDPGTLLSVGIQEAVTLLEREETVTPEVTSILPFPLLEVAEPDPETVGERVIVLIGDGETGENDERVSEAISEAREAGVRIHAIGVGTPEGAGMIMPAGTYQLGGQVVDEMGVRSTSQLREHLLQEVASLGGGQYTHTRSDAQIEDLGTALADLGVSSQLDTDKDLPIWVRYDVPFVLGLVALVLLLAESALDLTTWTRESLPARGRAR
jgi:Ca-activated chloride channel family protein